MIHWHFKSFYNLTKEELYQIIQLRIQVFVVEQDAPYQDCDDKDQKCFHLFGKIDNKIVAYCRLIPAGISYAEPCMGRVVTSLKIRRLGYGRSMVYLALQAMENKFGTTTSRISAQLYLQKFYESFGYQQVSEMYLEDGLPHIEMLRG